MLFNSYEFIFGFLPVSLVGFFVVGRFSHALAALWLALVSLFFYGWWNPPLVGLLLGSVLFNYGMGYAIGHAKARPAAKSLLIAALAANLGLLGYFKYTNFFIATVNTLAHTTYSPAQILLPLGISFFTFTQIAFLVDVYRGVAKEYRFVHYLLFVTYFPHLIAGPVLHHKQMMPQFALPETYRIRLDNLIIGLSLFGIGLAKKVLLADHFGTFADPLFAATGDKAMLTQSEAWVGAIAFTLQIYFDFSGYTDMALGLSKMFGITLPINFDSPYRSRNIIEFWRRWHMTLSQFLRDYLYFPLGGNRKGRVRRYLNLMVTMLLGGLWHGANWTFVMWGGLHGVYLVINHGWQSLQKHVGLESRPKCRLELLATTLLTFTAVIVAWVFFRAPSMDAALIYTRSMLRAQSAMTMLKPEQMTQALGLCGVGLAIVFLPVSSSQFFLRAHQQLRHSFAHGLVFGILLVAALALIGKQTSFIYFQF